VFHTYSTYAYGIDMVNTAWSEHVPDEN